MISPMTNLATKQAWVWDEGNGRFAPWRESKLPPYRHGEDPTVAVVFSQFAIFPTRADAWAWAGVRKLTGGSPRKITLST